MMSERTDTSRLGAPVASWTPPRRPDPRIDLEGRYVRLQALSADAHAALLYSSFEGHDAVWDYMPYGPFSASAQYHRWVRDVEARDDPFFLAIYDKSQGVWSGVASYLRINPEAGSIEVGHIALSPRLQRTRAATEAMALMMEWAFQTGYRRYEWKCNALNQASRRAAQRLGFSYEGVFRQAAVIKGRNRDTAWFAAIDKDWPALQEAFRVWLNPANFDTDGQQHARLSDLTRLARVADDPEL